MDSGPKIPINLLSHGTTLAMIQVVLVYTLSCIPSLVLVYYVLILKK